MKNRPNSLMYISFLETSDIFKELETLKSLISGYILYAKSPLFYLYENRYFSGLENYLNSELYFNEVPKGNFIFEKLSVDIHIDNVKSKCNLLCKFLYDFFDHFESNQDIKQCLDLLLKFYDKEINNSKLKRQLPLKIQVIYKSYSESELENNLDIYNKKVKKRINQFKIILNDNPQINNKSKIDKFIKSEFIDSFMMFEQELIDELWLSTNYEWSRSRADLARVLLALNKVNWLKVIDPKDIYTDAKKYFSENYDLKFSLDTDSFKKSKIDNISLVHTEIPLSNLTILNHIIQKLR